MNAPDTMPAAILLADLNMALARRMEIEDKDPAECDAHASELDELMELSEALVVQASHSTPGSADERDDLLRLASAMNARLVGDDLDDGERKATQALVGRLVDRAREYQGQDAGAPSRRRHIAAYFDNE